MSSSRPVTPNSRRSSGNNNSSGSGAGYRRHSHRSSGVYLLTQSPKIHYPIDPDHLPLESTLNTEKFERLSDSLEELDANITNLQSIHDAISNQFNESFASFLYGLSITMWCVDFPGCPTKESWSKLQSRRELDSRINELQDKLKQSKLKNEALKKKLKDQQPQERRSLLVNRAPPATTEEDSYLTNEGSFVSYPQPVSSSLATSRLSRIPQPIGKPSTREVTVTSSRRTGPNLNQPPRYLKGLFDSTNNRISTTSTSSTTPSNRTTKSILKSGPPRRNPPPLRTTPNRISKRSIR
ncbi:DASH complex subunit DAM1 [Scheffersomyces coipomensis]|uniref:DASH complex subunit DAM1 n=1 Tax=Scheffersomyces coipomensis TaxID=1788519 RepID=UPI00315D2B06